MPPPASNPDLWPFDLETGMRVASKVGRNLPSKFGHARPLGSRIIRYVRDGRTDRRRDRRTKATLTAPFAMVGSIIIIIITDWWSYPLYYLFQFFKIPPEYIYRGSKNNNKKTINIDRCQCCESSASMYKIRNKSTKRSQPPLDRFFLRFSAFGR